MPVEIRLQVKNNLQILQSKIKVSVFTTKKNNLDASGNPVTETITPTVQTAIVTDLSGNTVTGKKLSLYMNILQSYIKPEYTQVTDVYTDTGITSILLFILEGSIDRNLGLDQLACLKSLDFNHPKYITKLNWNKLYMQ